MPSSMTGGEPWRSPTPADVAADAYLHEVHAQTVAIYCHECYANAYQRYRTIAHSVTQTRIRDIVPLHEVGPPALRAGVCHVLATFFMHRSCILTLPLPCGNQGWGCCACKPQRLQERIPTRVLESTMSRFHSSLYLVWYFTQAFSLDCCWDFPC